MLASPVSGSAHDNWCRYASVASLQPSATAQASVNAGSVPRRSGSVVRSAASVSSRETPWLPSSLPTTSQASVALRPATRGSATASYRSGSCPRTCSEYAGSVSEGGPDTTLSLNAQNPMTPPSDLRPALSTDETGPRAPHDAVLEVILAISHHTDVTTVDFVRWSTCEPVAVDRRPWGRRADLGCPRGRRRRLRRALRAARGRGPSPGPPTGRPGRRRRPGLRRLRQGAHRAPARRGP